MASRFYSCLGPRRLLLSAVFLICHSFSQPVQLSRSLHADLDEFLLSRERKTFYLSPFYEMEQDRSFQASIMGETRPTLKYDKDSISSELTEYRDSLVRSSGTSEDDIATVS